MPPEINKELEQVIEEIATESKLVTMGLTIRQIQEAVHIKLGFKPATSTVSRVLRRLGIDTNNHPHKWTWGRK
jgi:transposase